MRSTHCPPILNYLNQLADSKNRQPVDAVLQQLANYFEASGIGITHANGATAGVARFYPDNEAPENYPWQENVQFVPQLRNSLTSYTHEDNQGEWLVSLAWEPRFGDELTAWLYRREKLGWSEADRALWPLAGQTLVRWLAQHTKLVTDNEKLSQLLEQTAQVSSRLTHDFGNYLTGILGFTELSMVQLQPDSLLHRYLQEVLQSARHGSDWIRRLHWFCRRKEKYTWPAELSSVLAEAELSLQKQQPTLEKQLPADLPLLAIDTTSLQTALIELMNNASEAVHEQGTATITARARNLTAADCRALLGKAQPGKYVEIAVADDGPGFSPEVRAKLFHEAFFSTKPRHRGLGLLMVYGILYRFCGGLQIDAAPETGAGACVRMLVPAVKVEVALPSNHVRPRLLLVHPNPLMYESLRKILEWEGCQVTIAMTAQAALNAYQMPGRSFALVVTEMNLPQLSGFDLARRILDRDPHAKFLFLHTHASFHGLAEEELLKRFELLRWPASVASFVQAVRTTHCDESLPIDGNKS